MEHDMPRKIIKDVTSDIERVFYASHNIDFYNIKIAGPADGESAFKESQDISVSDSFFELRYPFWHNTRLAVENCVMTSTCRAPFWYDKEMRIKDVKCDGVKAFRECQDIALVNSTFISEEIFWRCTNIIVHDSEIMGFYAFFESKNIRINNLKFKGKYSFQFNTDTS